MANKAFELNGTIVNPGERKTIDLQVAQLYTHTPLCIPVQVICGKRAGPTLLVCAAIHGDEINGVEVIRRLLKLKSLNRIRGTLVAVPIVNVFGFIQRTRYLPDRRDLNRCFPGTQDGTLGGRIANLFVSNIVERCTHAIDLHTAAIHRDNLPQIRVNMQHEQSAEMARAFGVPVILNAELREGSLRETADRHDIPVITYEAGEALRFNEVSIALGVRGVTNVMRQLSMIPTKQGRPERKIKPSVAKGSRWVRAEIDGILRPVVHLGARVEEGETLGMLGSPFGTQEVQVKAPYHGIVIGRVNLPLVNEGEALFHIARFDRVGEAERQMEVLVSEVTSNAELDPDNLPIV
ncbi:succinylglutamate desuccinylase [Hahella sp. CCB-MM4]|uniref:succinylglutamate desuccinylase/aspartoacylase family protein n=1 Tax=Hahella sp. (strain CCB-MM4) TaxID=1926491 RepID=UPI000B9B6898|nr:succinylglutamate desuccinylase/aspartoacylase family protein [Hahella sp. CCB-MM4]OZG69794.1 succinylglutamate desuccinylase [Hahella sp. CCB-MM4]